MTNDKLHTVIVNFTTDADSHTEALEKIGAYIASFLSQQPGFIESWLHEGVDGTGIVHYARWQCEDDFKAAGEKARVHPDLPALMAYKPSGKGYRIWASF